MWEQYAERHAGVCLVFEKAKLTKTVVASLESQGVAAPYHRPVRYSARRFDDALSPYLDYRTLHENSSPEAVREWVRQYHDGLFFHKTLDWETEHEYRFVATWPEDVYLYADIGDALDAVIVGERFPSWQLPAAVTSSRRLGAKCRLVSWSMGGASLSSLDEAFATHT
ncbi:MAG TPA: DUF2971 domain-containing protein [Conexibacter sp.]|nr:DUF2971 domain-containing protein [Conexibacter sp.]